MVIPSTRSFRFVPEFLGLGEVGFGLCLLPTVFVGQASTVVRTGVIRIDANGHFGGKSSGTNVFICPPWTSGSGSTIVTICPGDSELNLLVSMPVNAIKKKAAKF